MPVFKPRPGQDQVTAYVGGRMGVSAVPGSGKTTTLSYLASQIVAHGDLRDDQEVLVVTLVRSAVGNFSSQVANYVQSYGLLASFGYRVRTLHGLSNDIVRERPALVGLNEDFGIIDERESNAILADAVNRWIARHPESLYDYVDTPFHERNDIISVKWPQLVNETAGAFIKKAKDLRQTPTALRKLIDAHDLPLAHMCIDIFDAYQRGLAYRGAVDFQDLIRLALEALQTDPAYLERLRGRWPYILEDEAQDSSQLQEQILRLLTGDDGNWIRVGDPNQAIYETFTTADPRYLRDFLNEPGVQRVEMPTSGRSTESIMKLANFLIDWSLERHPSADVRQKAPLQPPHIQPTRPDDHKPNPPDKPESVHIRPETFSSQDEITAVVSSIGQWLSQPGNSHKTVAVLVPNNKRGSDVVRSLKEAGIDYVELLSSRSSTRDAAGALGNVLNYLAQPLSSQGLSMAYKVWQRDARHEPESAASMEAVAKLLHGCQRVEDFLWPHHTDWLDEVAPEGVEDNLRGHLTTFRDLIQRWQNAVSLPIDQLMLTIAGDLFTNAVDLAIAHSLALYLRRLSVENPSARLPDFTSELGQVARNERKLQSLSDDDINFNPDQHGGKVTVATMHSAKGLEWDRVYLMAVNNYDFPSALAADAYQSEKWFIRNKLNLQAESLAQLSHIISDRSYHEGLATHEARIEYVAERLRLLYVGITRARTDLVITYNTGRNSDKTEAIPMLALRTFWEKERS